jgi:hypothetical protein
MRSVARELGQGGQNQNTFAEKVFEVEKEIAEVRKTHHYDVHL